MRHNKFTLVELLVVICIASLLMGVVLPAFNRMVTGSAVDRLASNLKLRLERAQSQAASSRRHVALILPHGTETTWADSQEQAARLGGSRMCYVDYSNYQGAFEGWVTDDEWSTLDRGAFLVRAYKESEVSGSLAAGSVQKASSGTGMDSLIRNDPGENADAKPLKDISISTSGGNRTLSNSSIIFSPKGGIRSTENVYLVVAEAVLNNGALFYPGGDGSGSYNWVALKINRLTGKVEYYRP